MVTLISAFMVVLFVVCCAKWCMNVAVTARLCVLTSCTIWTIRLPVVRVVRVVSASTVVEVVVTSVSDS